MRNDMLRIGLLLVLCATTACSSRAPEKTRGGVPDLLVDTITFSGPETGCVPVYDNLNKTIITSPEYQWEHGISKPAACLLGRPRSVRVTFRSRLGIKSARIWAVGSAGGLNSEAESVLVTFTNGRGEGVFRVNQPPDRVKGQDLYWLWRYKDVAGKTSAESSSLPLLPGASGSAAVYNMGKTGPHKLYTLFTQPKAPMTIPWSEVLEYATLWAANGTTEATVRLKLATHLYSSGRFRYINSSAYNYWIGFELSDLLEDLKRPGYNPSMNCVDVANFYQVLSSALGLDDKMTTISVPDPFEYKPLLPIGLVSCQSGTWNYHKVNITTDKKIVDATAKVHCDTLSGGTLTLTEYLHLLTSTYGIGMYPDDLTISDPH